METYFSPLYLSRPTDQNAVQRTQGVFLAHSPTCDDGAQAGRDGAA